jgi:toxin YoeB
MTKIQWTESGWADYVHWQETDRDVAQRINALIKDCVRAPFAGIGKPEPLRGELSGYWSRRVTSEHRLIYSFSGKGENQALTIISCRFHYQDIGKKKH